MITNGLNSSWQTPVDLSPTQTPSINRTTTHPTARMMVGDTISPHHPLQGIANCWSSIWNTIVGWLTSVWNCLCGKSAEENPVQTHASFTPTQLAQLEATQVRDLAFWQIKMGSPIRGPGLLPRDTNFVDLSGRLARPGTCAALNLERTPQIGHYGPNYPMLPQLLTVKLPIRQLHLFPEAIRSQLANYDAEHLDLYLIVWRDISRVLENPGEPGKRNIIYHSTAFPDAQDGQTHNQNLPMGVFEPDGIDITRGPLDRAIPLNQFGPQNVHIHPYVVNGVQAGMCISPDQARFYSTPERPASTFYSACQFPNNRAAAFFGVILNTDDTSIESAILSDPLRNPNLTLQEYKAGIENGPMDTTLAEKITRLLTFYTGIH